MLSANRADAGVSFITHLHHPDMPTDRELVDRVLNGPNADEAWGTLVDRYTRYIHAIPVHMGLSPEHAADIHQDVWMKLLGRRRHALRKWSGDDLKPYLATITRRAALDLVRARSREEAEVEGQTEPAFERILSLKRCLELVWSTAVALFRVREIKMLQLLFVGHTSREIGARVGLNANAVDQSLHRIRRSLREEVRTKYPGHCIGTEWA